MPVERVTRVIGTSPVNFQDALEEGFKRAKKTLRGITHIKVVGSKVRVENNEIKEYVVEMDITFVLEDNSF
jgi:flavin-binding protein dodecin